MQTVVGPLLSAARFFASKQNAASIMLALVLFFVSGATGFTDLINHVLYNVEVPPYSVAVALLVFCYACAHLLVAAFIWVFANVIKVLRQTSASLIQRFSVLRVAYKARQHAKQQLEDLITSLSAQERAFLELFRADGVALQRTACDPLPNSTYKAHWGLAEKGLLFKQARDGSLVEHFTLASEALPALRVLVYNGKTPHGEIELSLHRVAAAQNSGGGALGGSR